MQIRELENRNSFRQRREDKFKEWLKREDGKLQGGVGRSLISKSNKESDMLLALRELLNFEN